MYTRKKSLVDKYNPIFIHNVSEIGSTEDYPYGHGKSYKVARKNESCPNREMLKTPHQNMVINLTSFDKK
jgi:hypothetical protein